MSQVSSNENGESEHKGEFRQQGQLDRNLQTREEKKKKDYEEQTIGEYQEEKCRREQKELAK